MNVKQMSSVDLLKLNTPEAKAELEERRARVAAGQAGIDRLKAGEK